MRKGAILSNFKGIDAFGKTLEDVKIRTGTGAALSIASFAIIFSLTFLEFVNYWRVHLDTSVIVDKSRGERITVNLNVTFPRVPCYLLSVDIVDVSGEHLRDITHNTLKTRLDSYMEPIQDANLGADLKSDLEKAGQSREASAGCGSCYGGVVPESGCCQTCEDVRQSYMARGWSFSSPEGVDQCVAEGWVEKIKSQSNEGCNLSGRLRLNKVVSTLQLSPGKSFQTNAMHMHDVVPYLKDGNNHHFGHIIHELNFQTDEEYQTSRSTMSKVLKRRLGILDNPLDKTDANAQKDVGQWMFQYFVKVVATQFQLFDGDRINTYQYSATSFKRDLAQADRGQNPDGSTWMHTYDALPGLFLNIEVSPMQVIHSEKRNTFATFLTATCAIVGGVLAVASLLDSFLYSTLKKA